MSYTIIVLLFLLALGAGIILLQIYLSKKDNRWSGFVLPIISFCISLVAVFSIAAFTTTGSISLQQLDENGVVVQGSIGNAKCNTANSRNFFIDFYCYDRFVVV